MFSNFFISSQIMFLKILLHRILLYSFVTHFQITKDIKLSFVKYKLLSYNNSIS